MTFLKRLKAEILFVSLIVFVAMTLCSCGEMSAPQRAVCDYFDALKALDFASAEKLIGSPGAYSQLTAVLSGETGLIENISEKCFIEFIYTNLSVKVTDCRQSGDKAQVSIKVTARNTDRVSEKFREALTIFTESEAYNSGSETQKYLSICEYIPEIFEDMKKEVPAVTTKIEITVYLNEQEEWIISPNKTLFDAISGKGN
ncbi:MAG: DUF4878 domain-containing protein [Eubacteriaceae bacterium]|nr:DUF4878 domain-containing protein [Eubacteriaceae bacterium]